MATSRTTTRKLNRRPAPPKNNNTRFFLLTRQKPLSSFGTLIIGLCFVVTNLKQNDYLTTITGQEESAASESTQATSSLSTTTIQSTSSSTTTNNGRVLFEQNQQSTSATKPVPPQDLSNNSTTATAQFCEDCLLGSKQWGRTTCQQRAEYFQKRYGHSRELARQTVLQDHPTNCRLGEAEPCRVVLENKVDYHYEIIESTALQYPLPFDKLQGCNHDLPIIFDIALTQQEPKDTSEKDGWIEYYTNHLQGQLRERSTDGKMAQFGNLVDYRSYNETYVAKIGISCDSYRFVNWLKENPTNLCVLHGSCGLKNSTYCGPKTVRQSCWLTPMMSMDTPEDRCFFVPSNFPKFDKPTTTTSMTAMTATDASDAADSSLVTTITNVCVTGARKNENFELLATAITELMTRPNKPTDFRLTLFQRKQNGEGIPLPLVNHTNLITIVQETNFLKYQYEITKCHLMLPLIDPINNPNYFPIGLRKLSGSIAQIIGNRIPAVMHYDLYIIWKDYLKAIPVRWYYTNNDDNDATSTFTKQFELALQGNFL